MGGCTTLTPRPWEIFRSIFCRQHPGQQKPTLSVPADQTMSIASLPGHGGGSPPRQVHPNWSHHPEGPEWGKMFLGVFGASEVLLGMGGEAIQLLTQLVLGPMVNLQRLDISGVYVSISDSCLQR